MRIKKIDLIFAAISMFLTGCGSSSHVANQNYADLTHNASIYYGQKRAFPEKITPTGERFFLFDPNKLAWGAYLADGTLVGYGRASGGAPWNTTLNRPSLTPSGSYTVRKMGDLNCISHRYPRPSGGALMPYCMFFLKNYAIHGAPDELVPDAGNITHGCIRVTLTAAQWLHDHFLTIGTEIKILTYSKQVIATTPAFSL